MWKFLKVMLVMFVMIMFTVQAFACNSHTKLDPGITLFHGIDLDQILEHKMTSTDFALADNLSVDIRIHALRMKMKTPLGEI